MNILGIAGQDRDAAAALIRDGEVLAAIEEEKLSRIKHVGISYAGGLPGKAIDFCLQRGGIDFDNLDYFAYYLEPYKMLSGSVRFRAARVLRNPSLLSLQAFPYYTVESLNNLRQHTKTKHLALARMALARMPGRNRFMAVNHQRAHGAGAFYSSEFERAAVIVMGNVGDMTTTALMTGSSKGLRVLGEARFPNSIGMVYSAVTAALGFGAAGEDHKTMWLAPTGQNEFADLFKDLVGVSKEGLPKVNLDYFDSSFRGGPALSERFFRATGLKPGSKESAVGSTHRNVAASLQARIDDVVCEIASRHRDRTGEEYLCLAGGVALNSLSNAAIEQRSGYKQIFVLPAAGNAGCSIGAALHVWHEELGNRQRNYQMRHIFLGPQFGEGEIKSVLDNCKLQYEYFLTDDKLIAEAARLLSQNMIVGWFRGRMEFGPRTLGTRSILASPVTELMRDNLNSYIKHREDFRPFSAAVPEERAAEFFEPSGLTDFLQGVSKVKMGKLQAIPAAVFGDGIARVQTVSRQTNPAFWKLIVKFGEITGVPVLLNTSFNLFGEPVVSTPREAVRGFYCSGIDCLAIGNFLIKK